MALSPGFTVDFLSYYAELLRALGLNFDSEPTIRSVSASPASGYLDTGDIVTFKLNMSEASFVDTANGVPTLTLNDGGEAAYVSGSGTRALTFSYTVGASGSEVNGLAVIAANLNGATIRDADAHDADLSNAAATFANIHIDHNGPSVQDVIVISDDALSVGETAIIKLDFGEAVKVSGTPRLDIEQSSDPADSTLNDAVYSARHSDLARGIVAFTYTATAQENAYGVGTGVNLLGVDLGAGAISDAGGNAADLSGAQGALGFVVDTIAPLGEMQFQQTVLIAGIGGTALNGAPLFMEDYAPPGFDSIYFPNDLIVTYSNGARSTNFQYVVKEGDHDSDGFRVVDVYSPSGQTIHDYAGNVVPLGVFFEDVMETRWHVQVDGTRPTVNSITSEQSRPGVLLPGDTQTFTLKFSELISTSVYTGTGVALMLSNGARAVLSGPATETDTLVFTYTVGPEDTSDVTVTGLDQSDGWIYDRAYNQLTQQVTYDPDAPSGPQNWGDFLRMLWDLFRPHAAATVAEAPYADWVPEYPAHIASTHHDVGDYGVTI